MKQNYKILSLLAAICLVMGMASATAHAQKPNGSITSTGSDLFMYNR